MNAIPIMSNKDFVEVVDSYKNWPTSIYTWRLKLLHASGGGLTQDEMMKRFEKTSLPDWALTILKKTRNRIYLFILQQIYKYNSKNI
jgi:hypothetical protein